MQQYEQHDIGKLWRPLNPEELANLKQSANNPGTKPPVILFEGKILDGWHWYMVCKELGHEATFEELTPGLDPYAFVMSRHEGRRHMDANDRAELADRWATYKQCDNQYTKEVISRGMTIEEAAKKTGSSAAQIGRFRYVKKYGVPELLQAVKDKRLPLKRAEQIAQLPKEEQATTLAKVKDYCKHGHKFTEETTKWKRDPDGVDRRHCKTCDEDRDAARRERARQQKKSTPGKKRETSSQLQERLHQMLREGRKPGESVGLTREQVDPDFKGSSMDWLDTYGHVQIMTKTELEADRKEAALMNWISAVANLREPLKKYQQYLVTEPKFELEVFDAWIAKSPVRQRRMNDLFFLIRKTSESIEKLVPLLNKYGSQNGQ